MALMESTGKKKENNCETLCIDCADKKSRWQGKKKLHYCRFTGQCLREAIKSCPYT